MVVTPGALAGTWRSTNEVVRAVLSEAAARKAVSSARRAIIMLRKNGVREETPALKHTSEASTLYLLRSGTKQRH